MNDSITASQVFVYFVFGVLFPLAGSYATFAYALRQGKAWLKERDASNKKERALKIVLGVVPGIILLVLGFLPILALIRSPQ